jgi:hypothetical protein
MTSLASTTEQRLAQIHETGYWRVLIHPTVYESGRISTPAECWRLVKEARVSLRGWDYPYVDQAEQVIQDDWVQSGVAFANHVELWRFYRSGQFIHQFAVTEDRQPPSLEVRNWDLSSPKDGVRTLSLLNMLYTVTEIMEFARRLAHREVLGLAATLRIELHGMEERRLVAPAEHLFTHTYTSDNDEICWEHTSLTASLIATAPTMAIDATTHILERFKWYDPPHGMLEEDQARFYRRDR